MGKMLYEAAFQGEGSMNALLKQFIWLSGQIKEKKNEERIQLRNVSFSNFSTTFRDLPFMPQGRLLHLGTGIGYPGWNKKIFATQQLTQWINSMTVLIN